jgi:hypothetical protein
LVDGSATFGNKTEYSQAKYLKRKKIKYWFSHVKPVELLIIVELFSSFVRYLKVFKVIKPTIRTLFEFNYLKHSQEIL